MNIILIFPPRGQRCGVWKNTFAEHTQIARQMGLGPYWQTMTVPEIVGKSDAISYLAFDVPDDFIPSTTNEPIT